VASSFICFLVTYFGFAASLFRLKTGSLPVKKAVHERVVVSCIAEEGYKDNWEKNKKNLVDIFGKNKEFLDLFTVPVAPNSAIRSLSEINNKNEVDCQLKVRRSVIDLPLRNLIRNSYNLVGKNVSLSPGGRRPYL
jgi:hypothetical protein